MWLALSITALALAIYIATLAPGLTFEHNGTDGGDLVSAAWTLGVPHPTGYPTFTMLAWLFTRIPAGSIAYRVNLLSASCAAGAVGLVFCISRELLPATRQIFLIPASTALSLAFSSLLWSQAVISEVYTLLMFFSALFLWSLLRWRKDRDDRFLWFAGLAMGVGLGNHLTLAFAAPSAVVLLWPQRRRWFRIQTLLPTLLLFVIGIGVYAYLPLAAAQHPSINWGNPQTCKGFLWVVTGEQYQSLAFGLDPHQMAGRLGAWALLLGDQFGWWGLVLALAGAGWLWQEDRQLVLAVLTWTLPLAIYAFSYDTSDSHVYLLSALMLLALLWGKGALYCRHMVQNIRPKWQPALSIVIALLPLASLGLHWQDADLSNDSSVHTYIHEILDTVPPDSLIVVRGDRSTFALWYGIYVEEGLTNEPKSGVAIVNAPMLAFSWYRDHVRYLYPDLALQEPSGASKITTDDLTRDLIARNITKRPIYATDPKDEWNTWFDFVNENNNALVFRVRLKSKWESEG